MQDVYHDDLRDFIRHGRLDAYDLTDEELPRFLELWRWSVYNRRTNPTSPDHDAHDMVNRLERHLYGSYGVEIEYNTRLLLRHELEAMLHMNILLEVPHALLYFLDPRRIWQVIPTLRQIARAQRIKPVMGEQTIECRGYPRKLLNGTRLRRIDLLRRRYWHRINPQKPSQRIRQDDWW
jgi:hypothetical protein